MSNAKSATNARRATDEMFIEAAHVVADQVTPDQLKLGMLFPPQSNILEVGVRPLRVATLVFNSDLARVRSARRYGVIYSAARLQTRVTNIRVSRRLMAWIISHVMNGDQANGSFKSCPIPSP